MKPTRSIIVAAVVPLAAVDAADAWSTSGATAGTAQAGTEAPAGLEERICTGERDSSSRPDRARERRGAPRDRIAGRVCDRP